MRTSPGGGSATSHKRKVALSRAQARTYGSQARQISTQARRQRRATARRAPRVGATIPVVGNVIAAPRRAPVVARNQRIQRKLDRAVRSAGATGSPYPVGRASDLYLAPQARYERRLERVAQPRGFGGARDFRAENPAFYARDTTPTARKLIQLDPTIRVSAQRRMELSSLIRQIGLRPTQELAAERAARRSAPALKILNQLQRGEYLAGGLIRGAKEGSVTKALEHAFKGAVTMEERYTPGTEIVGEGTGFLKGLARFSLDVGLDPTTWITLGGTSVVGKTAAKAAIRAESKAARVAYQAARSNGVSAKTARRLAKDAGRREGRKAFDAQMAAGEGRRGLTVRVAGGRTARRLAHRATPTRISERIARTRGGRSARERIAAERPAAAPLTRLTSGAVEAQSRGIRRLLGDERVDLTSRAARRVMGWHGRTRPVDVRRSEVEDLRAIRREARSAEEHGVRMSIARANLGRKLTDAEDAQVIDAIERNRLRDIEDPDVRAVAKFYRDDLRYRFRRESRQGVTAARTGQKSREEIRWQPSVQRHSQQRKRLVQRHRANERRIEKIDEEIAENRRQHVLAQENPLNESSYVKGYVPERAARREKSIALHREKAALQREQRKLRGAIRKQQAQLGRARSRLAAAQAERKAKAAGYFPRIPEENVQATKTLTQRLAETARPKREHISPKKPVPTSSKYRKHTATREELKQGSGTEQAAIARQHTKSGVSVAYRGIKGSRGERQGMINRQIAERFGERVPRDFDEDTLKALHADNKRVYKLTRQELTEVTDVAEIQRAARSQGLTGALAEGETRAARAHYLKAEGYTPPQIAKELAREPTRGRYVILRDPIVAEARRGEQTWDTEAAGMLYDTAMRGFKSLALATPQYLARNFAGDMFNAWTEENAYRLMRNSVRSQKALHQLGRYERGIALGAKGTKRLGEVGKLKKAGQRFAGLLPRNKRMIQLTPQQAREIAGPSGERLYNLLRKADPNLSKEQIRAQIEKNLSSGKIPAIQVAMLAEQAGVIRQGRFLELMQEGRGEFTKGVGKGRTGTTPWQSAVKRVEDSTRLATFLGGLQRGMSVREASARATKLHFDYGDLSTIERNLLRRAMPFYTFPSRNIPLQARQVLTRPGKYATVEKAREEAATQAGLDKRRYEKNLSEFERRQLPLPVKFGGKTYTLSMAQPFTDLNDVVAFGEGFTGGDRGRDILNIPYVPTKRVMESLGPLKTLLELPLNKSFYFREDIEPQGARFTQAPKWAVELANRAPGPIGETIRSLTEMGQFKKGAPVMWRKKSDFLLRSLMPGIVGSVGEAGANVTGLGAEKNWRGRTSEQKILNFLTGIRSTTYDAPAGRERTKQERYHQLQTQLSDYRELAKGAGITDPDLWKTAKYNRMLRESNRLRKQLEGEEPEQSTGDPRLQRLREARGARIQRRADPRLEQLRELRAKRLAAARG